jgi:hypothetical protein
VASELATARQAAFLSQPLECKRRFGARSGERAAFTRVTARPPRGERRGAPERARKRPLAAGRARPIRPFSSHASAAERARPLLLAVREE